MKVPHYSFYLLSSGRKSLLLCHWCVEWISIALWTALAYCFSLSTQSFWCEWYRDSFSWVEMRPGDLRKFSINVLCYFFEFLRQDLFTEHGRFGTHYVDQTGVSKMLGLQPCTITLSWGVSKVSYIRIIESKDNERFKQEPSLFGWTVMFLEILQCINFNY